MLGDVGQCLLDHPVDDHLHPVGELQHRRGGGEVDPDSAAGLHVLGQPVQRGDQTELIQFERPQLMGQRAGRPQRPLGQLAQVSHLVPDLLAHTLLEMLSEQDDRGEDLALLVVDLAGQPRPFLLARPELGPEHQLVQLPMLLQGQQRLRVHGGLPFHLQQPGVAVGHPGAGR